MIYVDIVGLGEFESMLNTFVSRLANMEPVFQDIRQDFIASEKELFASEGGTGTNGTWDGWSDSYANWREWKHPEAGNSTMILTGGLLDSLVGAGPGHVFELTEHEMRIGTDLPGANGDSLGAIHYGLHTVKYPYGNTSASSMQVVGRKVIDPTMAEMNTWSRMVFSHILGEIV